MSPPPTSPLPLAPPHYVCDDVIFILSIPLTMTRTHCLVCSITGWDESNNFLVMHDVSMWKIETTLVTLANVSHVETTPVLPLADVCMWK